MNDAPPRCKATTLMQDDHWGGFTTRCELEPAHDGPHTHGMTACDPVAWLSWVGDYSGDRLDREANAE